MITYIKGKLIEKEAPYLVIEAGYLAYELNVSMNTFYQLPKVNETSLLYTHLLIREDRQVLYGFTDRKERKIFQELIKINSVGPKMALAILSNMNAAQIVHMIENKDVSILRNIPGIGQKTSERLLLEMKNRFHYLVEEEMTVQESFSVSTLPKARKDAMNALTALGYSTAVANKAVYEVKSYLSTEELIRKALQSLFKH